jgi:hypothetical protein
MYLVMALAVQGDSDARSTTVNARRRATVRGQHVLPDWRCGRGLSPFSGLTLRCAIPSDCHNTFAMQQQPAIWAEPSL